MRVIRYGNPILRKEAREVSPPYDGKKEFIKSMLDVMGDYNGIGLAAPQVGVSERIIIGSVERQPYPLINPKILYVDSEKEYDEEGCLSLPGIYLEILRYKHIVLEGFDIDGNPVRIQVSDLDARVFQHEIDHLDGILMIDRISVKDREAIRNTLKKIEDEELNEMKKEIV